MAGTLLFPCAPPWRLTVKMQGPGRTGKAVGCKPGTAESPGQEVIDWSMGTETYLEASVHVNWPVQAGVSATAEGDSGVYFSHSITLPLLNVK